MSEKNYPPGAAPPASTAPAFDAPPAYPGQVQAPTAAYPTQPGAAYPTQPGPAYPGQTGAPVTTTVVVQGQQGPTNAFGDSDIRYRAGDVSKLSWVLTYPMCAAITFFIVNCIIPGFGCWMGCVFLCGAHTIVKEDKMIGKICIAFGVGFLSLLTAAFGIGYMLAIWWSMATIANNRLYHNNPISRSEIKTTSGPMVMGM